MKILHIQSGNLSEGAARGAFWLHLALKKNGIHSNFLIKDENSHAPNVFTLSNSKFFNLKERLGERFERLLLKPYKNKEQRIFSTGLLGHDITKLKVYEDADIIHMHWINARMINIKLFSKIKKPIVWTFRDMWPFTGGCHYSLACTKYEVGCGNCVQLKSSFRHDLSSWVINTKKKNFKNNIHPVAISHWLRESAQRSLLFKNFDIKVIPNGVDIDIFKPMNKNMAKQLLDLPLNKKIVLIVAQNIGDFYKGFDKFIEAINLLEEDYFYIFLGNFNGQKLKNVNYKSFGFLHDDISLRLIYSAADVFVASSIQEAFGKTLIEAMACGTPVVCFDATGPKDIVDHKINGYKASLFEAKDLAHGISWVLSDEVRLVELGKNARQKVENAFDIVEIAKKYTSFYEKILLDN